MGKKIFCYGSNMSSSRLISRVGKAQLLSVAFYPDQQIIFNKISFIDGTAKANMTPRMGSCVYGVVYKLKDQAVKALDGLEMGYQRSKVKLIDLSGEYIYAETYISRFIDPSILPTNIYKNHVITGAFEHHLPICYINSIQAVQTVDG